MSHSATSVPSRLGILDAAVAPRTGEEIDLARLSAYLQAKLPGTTDWSQLSVEQFPGGYSNLTYLLTTPGGAWVLRRPPHGSTVKTAHDMAREHRILTALHGRFPVPRPVLFCDDPGVVGAPFYLMERLHGLILRRELPAGLTLSAPVLQAVCESLIDRLADLHRLDHTALGLSDLGRPDGYVARQVSGWSRRLQDALTEPVPKLDEVTMWLETHLPPSPKATLIHNDYKLDNLVLDASDPARILGLLDWEMATIGDPLMDLGTALCYWVQADDPGPLQQARFGPTHQPGCLTRRELATRYAARTGLSLLHLPFYYAFGLFKTAGVVQQIFFRYKQGLTQDPRFAGLSAMTKLLVRLAHQAIQTGVL